MNTVPTFDDANKTLALTFVVDAGRRLSVRQVRFEGNTVSADTHCVKKCVSKKGLGITHN